MIGKSRYVNQFCGSIRVTKIIIVLGLLGVLFGANVWAGGCGDPRAQICNPGQWADTSGDQTICRSCTGNTFADGCTRSCSACTGLTVPNADHSICVSLPSCPPGSGLTSISYDGKCVPCTGDTGSDGGSVQCTPCPSGQGNCDGQAANRCETPLNTDPNNCGKCGNKCATPTGGGSAQCTSGKCLSSCPYPKTLCGEACVAEETDPNNCGKCGNRCPSGQTCSHGTCQSNCEQWGQSCSSNSECCPGTTCMQGPNIMQCCHSLGSDGACQ